MYHRFLPTTQGTNALFQYFLGPSVSVPFSVDAVTGVVSVSSPLNYEAVSKYEFIVSSSRIFFFSPDL